MNGQKQKIVDLLKSLTVSGKLTWEKRGGFVTEAKYIASTAYSTQSSFEFECFASQVCVRRAHVDNNDFEVDTILLIGDETLFCLISAIENKKKDKADAEWAANVINRITEMSEGDSWTRGEW